jgi:hypothetical protein
LCGEETRERRWLRVVGAGEPASGSSGWLTGRDDARNEWRLMNKREKITMMWRRPRFGSGSVSTFADATLVLA